MNTRRSMSVDLLETRRLFAAGANDTLFSDDGLVTHSFGKAQDGIDTVVDSSGRVIVVGDTDQGTGNKDAFIERFTAAGAIDNNFGDGGDGVTIYTFGGTDDVATCVAIQPLDGKILVGGFTGDSDQLDFFVARFTTGGILDNSFSTDGKVQVDFSGGVDAATGIAVDSNGNIYVTGTSASISNGVGVAIARLTSGGSLDTSFSGDGKVVDAPSIFSQTGYAGGRMVIDSQNRLVIAVTQLAASIDFSGITITGADMGIARYTTQGAADTSFSSDGKAFVGFNRSLELATSVAIDPRTGKLILAGTTANGTAAFGASLPQGVGNLKAATRANFAVARFTIGGGLDSTFSGDGKLQIDFGATLLDGASDVVCDDSGRITISGGSQVRKMAANIAAARVSPGGGMDGAFDGDGLRIIDLGGSEGAFGNTIQTNGNVILVGHFKQNATRGRVFAIRLLDD